MQEIHLTQPAIDAFLRKLKERNTPDAYIRLGIKGLGCAGYEYVIQYEDAAKEKDEVIVYHKGVHVLIDPKSMSYLEGCVLTYEETLMGQGFRWENPRVSSSCGCGKSFTMKEKP